jgi:hypothetical protein
MVEVLEDDELALDARTRLGSRSLDAERWRGSRGRVLGTGCRRAGFPAGRSGACSSVIRTA